MFSFDISQYDDEYFGFDTSKYDEFFWHVLNYYVLLYRLWYDDMIWWYGFSICPNIPGKYPMVSFDNSQCDDMVFQYVLILLRSVLTTCNVMITNFDIPQFIVFCFDNLQYDDEDFRCILNYHV
jgi:hypothetical protein